MNTVIMKSHPDAHSFEIVRVEGEPMMIVNFPDNRPALLYAVPDEDAAAMAKKMGIAWP